MDKNTEEKQPGTYKVTDLFDQILGRNLERLIGARYGIEELPLNIATISCLAFITERQNDPENDQPDESERHTRKTLFQKLDEMGFITGDELDTILKDMGDRGYIEFNEHDQIIAKKPAMSMAQLIDRAFPNMPGINLVAYFVQTIDEVQSDRKDIQEAAQQFDHLLKMQGEILRKHPPKSHLKKKSTRPLMPPQTSIASWQSQKRMIQTSATLGQNLSDFYTLPIDEIKRTSAQKDESDETKGIPGPESIESEAIAVETDSPPVITDISGDLEYPTGRNLSDQDGDRADESGKEAVSEIETDARLEEATELSDGVEAEITPGIESRADHLTNDSVNAEIGQDDSSQATDHPLEATLHAAHDFAAENDIEAKEMDEKFSLREDQSPLEFSVADNEIKDPYKAESSNDEDIDKKVTTFEEDLAMICPLCGSYQVETKKTAKGKEYYGCQNRECNLITWGRPYHIACPVCQNPFLVEATDKAGKAILKCPRATCRYRQKIPSAITGGLSPTASTNNLDPSAPVVKRKPRRKVRRRRVVRRKR